jgi:hypothetical protein
MKAQASAMTETATNAKKKAKKMKHSLNPLTKNIVEARDAYRAGGDNMSLKAFHNKEGYLAKHGIPYTSYWMFAKDNIANRSELGAPAAAWSPMIGYWSTLGHNPVMEAFSITSKVALLMLDQLYKETKPDRGQLVSLQQICSHSSDNYNQYHS